MTIISFVYEFGLLGLFLITMFSATIVPFPPEPAIFLSTSIYDPILVFIIALIGGICGATINYYIGLKGIHSFLVKRSPKKEKKAQKWFNKWGQWIIMLVPFIPFLGDPLTLVAGTLSMNLKKFYIFYLIGISIKLTILIYSGEILFNYLASMGIIF